VQKGNLAQRAAAQARLLGDQSERLKPELLAEEDRPKRHLAA
jgi:hypothetical protein